MYFGYSLSSFLLGIVVCHELYGVEFKTPRMRFYVIFLVTLPFAYLIKWSVTHSTNDKNKILYIYIYIYIFFFLSSLLSL